MNQPSIMGILQSRGDLLDVGDNGCRRQATTLWVTLAQCAIGGIIHHQKRDALLHAKVQHTHYVGMPKAGDSSCFIAELLHTAADQAHLEYFDGRLGIQMNMLAEVYLGKATVSYQTTQAVVPKLLSHSVNHFLILPWEFCALILYKKNRWYVKTLFIPHDPTLRRVSAPLPRGRGLQVLVGRDDACHRPRFLVVTLTRRSYDNISGRKAELACTDSSQ